MVEEDGEINIISKDALANQQQRVRELKKIVTEKEKLEKEAFGRKDPTTGIFGGTQGKALPKQFIKKQEQVFISREEESRSLAKIRGQKLQTGSEGAPVKRDEFSKVKNQVKKQQSKLDEIDSKLGKAVSAIKDPQAFFLQFLGPIAKILGTSGIIAQIANIIHERILKEFGPGGRLDVRKLVRDAVREFIPIELQIARDRGEVFFGTAARVTQAPPQFSNTERLQDGRSRDLQRNMGY